MNPVQRKPEVTSPVLTLFKQLKMYYRQYSFSFFNHSIIKHEENDLLLCSLQM